MNPLYMTDAYLQEFHATVAALNNPTSCVLDQTAFYPNSGGQPHDEGTLTTTDGTVYRVVLVTKADGQIIHQVDKPGLQMGDRISGKIDWERRYRLMRMHTAAHIISAVLHTTHGALITGNQLGIDKSRIDYNMDEFDKEKLARYVAEADAATKRDVPVSITFMEREQALQDPSMIKLAGVLPPMVKELRIVQIGDVDTQADGGTHVHYTREIGTITFVKAENKGKNNRRLYYTVE
ncbi:alanyl-tRNA editing protein [Candidatus Woesearchaeota archaeon]|nr:alanyl-tRNA editing protein [Candidatus Woesearchaeota archaeon]